MDKPIHLGPFAWTFKLGGVVKDAKGALIGAQSISLSPDTTFEAAGIGGNFLCFLKCAGLAIAPILLTCLPRGSRRESFPRKIFRGRPKRVNRVYGVTLRASDQHSRLLNVRGFGASQRAATRCRPQ